MIITGVFLFLALVWHSIFVAYTMRVLSRRTKMEVDRMVANNKLNNAWIKANVMLLLRALMDLYVKMEDYEGANAVKNVLDAATRVSNEKQGKEK